MSIATEITRLSTAKADIKTAIEAKGVTVPSSAKLDTYDQYIAAISGASVLPDVNENDVNFWDYDGRLIASYSASEFAALTALPDNPTRDGLTAQGWNWTLADAKTHVAAFGYLDIGQMYRASDGVTKIWVEVPYDGFAATMKFYQNGANTVHFCWGDTNTEFTLSTNGACSTTHTYQKAGGYIITMYSNGNFFELGNRTNSFLGTLNPYIRKVVLSNHVRGLNMYCFQDARMSTPLNIPTSMRYQGIGQYAFDNCYIPYLTLPTGLTEIPINAFYESYAIHHISLPKSITAIDADEPFRHCDALRRLCIPSGAALSGDGTYTFGYCATMNKLVLPSGFLTTLPTGFLRSAPLREFTVPASVTAINNYALNSVSVALYLLPTTPPTLTNKNAINSSIGTIYVPNGKLSAYQGASNWSSFSSKMVEMPAS